MIEHILVPLDGSALAEKALPHAVAVARSFEARVTLLRVVERASGAGGKAAVDPLDWEISKAEAEAYLDETGERLEEIDLAVDRVLLEGDAAKRITGFAQEEKVGLVVLSSHGQSGLSEWNINSVVQKVLLRAFTPALVVRAYRPAPDDLTGLRYRRLMVPLDGSERAECVLPLAEELARSGEATILLAHVVAQPQSPRRIEVTEEEQELRERLAELNRGQASRYLSDVASNLSAESEIHLLEGNTPVELRKLVEDEEVSLVLLSAHGHSGQPAWPYGSVALNFIAYGTVPLLIVQDIPREEIEETEAARAAQERSGH